MKNIKNVPNEYNGNFESFYKEYIEPNLPDPESVKIAHNLIINYLKNEKPLYVVRKFSEFSQRGHIYSFHGINFIVGDNEPALWFYARSCNQLNFSQINFESIIQDQLFPIGFSTNKRKKNENKEEWKTWGKEKWEIEFCNKGWFHAHLYDAAKNISLDLSKNNFNMRMIRYLHPANHFPMPSHYKNRYITRLNSKDMSEQEGIKAFIINKYKERYSEIWDEFISMANINQHNFPTVPNVQLSFEKGGGESEGKINNPLGKKLLNQNAVYNTSIQILNSSSYGNTINISDKTRLKFIKREIENLNSDFIIFKIKCNGSSTDPRIIDLIFKCKKEDLKTLFKIEGKDWQVTGEYHWPRFPVKAEQYIISGVLGSKKFNDKIAA